MGKADKYVGVYPVEAKFLTIKGSPTLVREKNV